MQQEKGTGMYSFYCHRRGEDDVNGRLNKNG
jgi:hypothetical protein